MLRLQVSNAETVKFSIDIPAMLSSGMTEVEMLTAIDKMVFEMKVDYSTPIRFEAPKWVLINRIKFNKSGL